MYKFMYQSLVILSVTVLLSGCGTSTSTSGHLFMNHTYLLRDDGNGGKIYLDSTWGSYSDVISVANQYCREKRLGTPSIGPNILGRTVQHYEFKCATSVIPAPRQDEQIKSTPIINSMESAKKKCSELGFKTGTEQFGNCVLKLSK
jgi:hypothetical protein